MRRVLALDFLADRHGPGPAGIALLLVGVAAAAAAGIQWSRLQSQIAALQGRIAEAGQGTRRDIPTRAGAVDAKALSIEIGAANEVVRQLNVPWDTLFGELERAASDGVALLAVQPDAESGQVRISGDRKSVV